MGCKLQYDISLVCGDTLYPGGVQGKLWAGYVEDLSAPLPKPETGFVTSITFKTYMGLKRLEGIKYAHLFATEGLVGAGGNVSLTHRATIKLLTTSSQDDAQIIKLMQATDIFFFYKDGRGDYKIFGPSGMRYAAGPLFSQGQNPGDDVSDTLIFESTETVKPLRFAPTGITDIDAYLDALVV